MKNKKKSKIQNLESGMYGKDMAKKPKGKKGKK